MLRVYRHCVSTLLVDLSCSANTVIQFSKEIVVCYSVITVLVLLLVLSSIELLMS